MTAVELPPPAIAPLSRVVAETRALFDMQLRVARRADSLARRQPVATRENDRRTWLRAECEVFENVETAVVVRCAIVRRRRGRCGGFSATIRPAKENDVVCVTAA